MMTSTSGSAAATAFAVRLHLGQDAVEGSR